MTSNVDKITTFRDDVYRLMKELPDDKITTYGDIAAYAGHPLAARVVGTISHNGPDSLPWHKLVNRYGGLSVGFPGGQSVQKQLLEQDGIECTDGHRVRKFKELRWKRL